MKVSARGVLFDLDGTIYEGTHLIPCAAETLHWCRQQGLPYRFVTNTTSKPRAHIVAKLASFGIETSPDEILTAPSAARELLLKRGLTRCHLLLPPELLVDLDGITPTDEDPQAVVIGDLGHAFTYDLLNHAFRLLLDDPACHFLTLARNRYFQTDHGLTLDSGPFTAALEFATARPAELVGKPAPTFFHTAAASLALPPAEVLMIGDDLESDALGAQAAGLQGALVRTGKYRSEQLASNPQRPDAIWNSIADLPHWLIFKNKDSNNPSSGRGG
ncbi:TIGR01458 family HAD-type hydrolase [soil metagenome]